MLLEPGKLFCLFVCYFSFCKLKLNRDVRHAISVEKKNFKLGKIFLHRGLAKSLQKSLESELLGAACFQNHSAALSVMENNLCRMLLKTWNHNQGGGRMALIAPGPRVGTVQLMLLNLLQAVVIMADISLLRVTKSREGNFPRPLRFTFCQAVHCWDDHRACQRLALESLLPEWCNMATLWNTWEATSNVFLKLYWECPQEQKIIRTCPEREEGMLPQLAHKPKQLNPLPLLKHSMSVVLDLDSWIWKLKPSILARFALCVNVRSAWPKITALKDY